MEIKVICIVDDDQMHQSITEKIIRKIDATKEIVTFSNGIQVYEFISENTNNPWVLPDIIFLDTDMPLMNGWQFLEEFAKIKPTLTKQINIYLVSSFITEYDVDKAKSISHVKGHFVKPVTIDICAPLMIMDMAG